MGKSRGVSWLLNRKAIKHSISKVGIMPLRKILMYFENHVMDEGLSEEEETVFYECRNMNHLHCRTYNRINELTL